jgi:hypothetical protein
MLRYACAFALLLVFTADSLAQRRPRPADPATPEALQAAWERHQELDRTTLFKGLEWRSVGPVVQGGRLVDIEGVPGEPYTFYVAYASGGIWKTTNNGITFEPLFDDSESSWEPARTTRRDLLTVGQGCSGPRTAARPGPR